MHKEQFAFLKENLPHRKVHSQTAGTGRGGGLCAGTALTPSRGVRLRAQRQGRGDPVAFLHGTGRGSAESVAGSRSCVSADQRFHPEHRPRPPSSSAGPGWDGRGAKPRSEGSHVRRVPEAATDRLPENLRAPKPGKTRYSKTQNKTNPSTSKQKRTDTHTHKQPQKTKNQHKA